MACTITGDGPDKVQDASIYPEDLVQKLTLGTAQATTSGTYKDFTGIPNWVKRITVVPNGVSLSGVDDLLIQIGVSGTPETTSYVSGSGSAVNSTAGFVVRGGTSGRAISGAITLFHSGSNVWVSSHSVTAGTTADFSGGGTKTLAGVLDMVRVTRTGTDTFDAGSVNIMYEG
jgi:hypothetical protein